MEVYIENIGRVVEVQLEAGEFQWEIAPGKSVDAWGFNRQLPGPVLKVTKGDTLVEAGMMANFDIISGDQQVPESASHHKHYHQH